MLYLTNITVGGLNFTVQVDTGSSDLWVNGPVDHASNTGFQASLTYLDGSGVGGFVKSATVAVGEFTVENQAFIDSSTGFSKDQGLEGMEGLLGVGPSNLSTVHSVLNSSKGDTILDNLFKQDPSTPNFISFLLGRTQEVAAPFPGEFTVGEVIPGLEEISNQPKLTVAKPTPDNNPYWSVFLDENGIVGPQEQVISYNSSTTGSSNGNAPVTVVLDTGSSLSILPESVVDAIWHSVPGAKIVNVSGDVNWGAPCAQEVNLAFKFGGKTYPIHPLDVLTPQPIDVVDGQAICRGGFQRASPPQFLFGDTFLRSVYMLINMGDFIDGTSVTADPYIQLLSIANDSAVVHEEFAQAAQHRLFYISATIDLLSSLFSDIEAAESASGVPNGSTAETEGGSASTGPSVPAQTGNGIPQSDALETTDRTAQGGLSRTTIIAIASASAFVAAVLVGIAIFCVFRKRAKHGTAALNTSRAYRRLDAPVPEGEALMYPLGSRQPYHQGRFVEKIEAELEPYRDAASDNMAQTSEHMEHSHR